jgi:hypothetical protein
MTDETPEINSAEAEAEKIFEEAFASIDLNGEDCPQGDECAIHHRMDEEVIDDDIQFGRLITYVGDNVVITTDNPELENPVFLLKMVLGKISKDEIPPLYETCVIHVGEEGTLADLRALDTEDRAGAIRFVQQHSDWEGFKGAHEMVVTGIKEDLIDVSRPAFPQEG